MKFQSSKDVFYIIMVSLFILILWTPVIFLFKVMSWAYYVVVGILTPLIILYLLLVRYEINGDDLVCKTFLRKQRIKISTIKSITKCKNSYISFATALERLEVRFGVLGGEKWSRIYISPKETDEFLKNITEKNPNIMIIEKVEKSKNSEKTKEEKTTPEVEIIADEKSIVDVQNSVVLENFEPKKSASKPKPKPKVEKKS